MHKMGNKIGINRKKKINLVKTICIPYNKISNWKLRARDIGGRLGD
jgi:hypothetical protein